MSRHGDVVLPFGGEDRTFRLGIGEWRKVQEAVDAGPSELLARMAPAFTAMRRGVKFEDLVGSGLLGRWRVDDIRSVVFHALIGGGESPPRAQALTKMWVDERPLLEALPIAYQVVLASVCGASDERASGEAPGETADRPRSPEESSGSASTASTPKAGRSGSRRAKSTS